jgi:hypothetical protein
MFLNLGTIEVIAVVIMKFMFLQNVILVDFLKELRVVQRNFLALSSGWAKNRSLNTELPVSADMLAHIYKITRYHLQKKAKLFLKFNFV